MKEPSTYNRKYYLIRKIKAAGFQLQCRNNERIILVPLERYGEASRNSDIQELTEDFGYGVQVGTIQIDPYSDPEPGIIKTKQKTSLFGRLKEWIALNW